MDKMSIKIKEEEILLGIMQFLRSRGYLDTFIKLERETGLQLDQHCREIEFFRSLVLDGQFKEAEVFLELFKAMPKFPYNRCLFELKKQFFFELIEFNDDQQKIITLLREIEEIVSKEEYKHLTSFLTLKRINDDPNYASWNTLRGRLSCFEFIKEHLELIYSSPKDRDAQSPDLIKNLIIEATMSTLQDPSNVQYVGKLRGEISLFDQKLFGKSVEKAKKAIELEIKPIKKQEFDLLQASISDLRSSGFAARPDAFEYLVQSMQAANLKSNFQYFGSNDLTEKLEPKQQMPPKQQPKQSSNYNSKYSEQIEYNEESKSEIPSNYEFYSEDKKKPDRNQGKEPQSNFWNQGKENSDANIERIENERLVSGQKYGDNQNESYQTTARRVSKNSSSNEEIEKNVIIEKLLLSDTNREFSDNEEVNRANLIQEYYKTEESSAAETFQDLIEIYSIKDSHPIRAACFNTTGDSFAIGTNSKSLKLYSLALSSKRKGIGKLDPARMFWEKQNHHTGSIYAIDWSKSNRFIATGSNDKMIKILSIPDIENDTDFLELKLQGHKGIIRSLCFSSDSLELYSASTDCLIKIWDVEQGEEKVTLEGHTNAVYSIQVSVDNTFCVSVGMDRALKVWDLRSAKRSLSIDTKDFSEMNYVSLSEGNKSAVGANKSTEIGTRVAAVAHTDGLITLWDLANPKTPTQVRIHSADCRSVEYDAKSNYLLSASFDNTIGIYDIKQQTLKAQLPIHSDRVVLAKWHPTLPIILSTSADCTARIVGPKKLFTAS